MLNLPYSRVTTDKSLSNWCAYTSASNIMSITTLQCNGITLSRNRNAEIDNGGAKILLLNSEDTGFASNNER